MKQTCSLSKGSRVKLKLTALSQKKEAVCMNFFCISLKLLCFPFHSNSPHSPFSCLAFSSNQHFDTDKRGVAEAYNSKQALGSLRLFHYHHTRECWFPIFFQISQVVFSLDNIEPKCWLLGLEKEMWAHAA